MYTVQHGAPPTLAKGWRALAKAEAGLVTATARGTASRFVSVLSSRSKTAAPEARAASLGRALIHPPLLEVLAAAGHGSRILIADGNYAARANSHPRARVIHLNLRPGLITVDQALEVVADAIPVESATMMQPDDGSSAILDADYRKYLATSTPLTMLDRDAFYQACRDPALDATIATGDQRYFANILLTVGALDGSLRTGRP